MTIDDTTTGLTFQYLNLDDNIGTWIEKQNNNLRTIAQAGGGPIGRLGPQGVPGCPGGQGPVGPAGENASDEWITGLEQGCLSNEVHDYDDIIMNKWAQKGLLLSNLVDSDNTISFRGPDEVERTFKWVVTTAKDHKFKIISSNTSGKGNHIALANSKAIQNNTEFLCASGFDISLDYFTGNEENLRITGTKNTKIPNHKHTIEFSADRIDINKNLTSQSISFDSKDNTLSNYKGIFELVSLTNNRKYNIPDRSGYLGIWQDTLVNSESWEILNTTNIDIHRFRYSNLIGFHELQSWETPWVTLIRDSNIKFKRLNNFVLIDFHIGIEHISGHGNFSLENLQLKINKETIGCQTQSWHSSVILSDERYVPINNNSFNSFGMFSISSTTENSFLISLRFLNNNGLIFSDNGNETYWISGQVWATVQDVDNQCIMLDINQSEECIQLIGTQAIASTSSTTLNYTLLEDYEISLQGMYIPPSREAVDCQSLKAALYSYLDPAFVELEYDKIANTLAPMQARYIYWYLPYKNAVTDCDALIIKMYMQKDQFGNITCDKINNIKQIVNDNCGTSSTAGTSLIIPETCFELQLELTPEMNNFVTGQGYRFELDSNNILSQNPDLIYNTVVKDMTFLTNGEPTVLIPTYDVDINAYGPDRAEIIILSNYTYTGTRPGDLNYNLNYGTNGNIFNICVNGYTPSNDGLSWLAKNIIRTIPQINSETVIQNNETHLIIRCQYTNDAKNNIATCITLPDQYSIKDIISVKNLRVAYSPYTLNIDYTISKKLNVYGVAQNDNINLIRFKDYIHNGWVIDDIIEIEVIV